MDDISIFFAIEAEELLENGDAAAAADLCRRGIEQYQDYPLAYTVLARAYKSLGDEDSMMAALNEGGQLFPGNKTIRAAVDSIMQEPEESLQPAIEPEKYYDGIMDSPAGEDRGYTANGEGLTLGALMGGRGTSTHTHEHRSKDIRIIPGLNAIMLSRKAEKHKKVYTKLPLPPKLRFFESANIPDDFQNYTNCFLDMSFEEIPVEDYFLSKARQIKSASAAYKPAAPEPKPAPKPNKLPDEDNGILASDTIAKIYEVQGAFGEALKVYEALLEAKPAKREFYLGKIEEMKKKV